MQLAGFPDLGELCLEPSAAVDPIPKKSVNNMHKKVRARIRANKAHKMVRKENLNKDVYDDNLYTELSSEVVEALKFFGKDQFIFGSDVSWPPRQAGFIDLFSGRKGFAHACSRLGAPWILCVDILDGPQCDLLQSETRCKIETILKGGGCLHLSAAPICASFSRAITPYVRSRQYPRGLPTVSGEMLKKIRDGNSSDWLGMLIEVAIGSSTLFWVENPDSSFLWLQRIWIRLGASDPRRFLKVDFCSYGTPWRKRTRFLTNGRLKGCRNLCSGQHQHIVLRGRSKRHRMAWTKVAEPYPRRLCRVLAAAACADLGLLASKNRSPCFCNHLRIGEAKNPGPRRRFPHPKDVSELDGVELIRPETVAMGKIHFDKFIEWMRTTMDDDCARNLWLVPQLCGNCLAAYGRHWYASGGALYAFRHLVVYLQRTYPVFKGQLQEAWNLIAKWEELEPVAHRKPLPYSMLQSMAVLAIKWKWRFVAAVLIVTFHACARPGEVLKATRRNLVLPQDVGEVEGEIAFLKIAKPKPGRRGLGRVQHARITGQQVCTFLTSVYGSLASNHPLYPGSAGAFRTRWNSLLRGLGVPSFFNLTPGCLRAGGTVHLYKMGTPIMDILWFLRLKNLETLQHYLQEISTEVTMIDLPTDCRLLIQNLSLLYPLFLTVH